MTHAIKLLYNWLSNISTSESLFLIEEFENVSLVLKDDGTDDELAQAQEFINKLLEALK